MQTTVTAPTPWYRERWPWLLISGPATVIVAGIITVVLAVRSADGVVANDYYKQGLAVNQVKHRDEVARQLGYLADVQLQPGRIALMFRQAAPEAAMLTLNVLHPTQSGKDQQITLQRTGPGQYAAALPSLSAYRWHLIVEDMAQTWRIAGIWAPAMRTGLLQPGV